jgi:ATP-dependent helicase HrpB
MISLPIYAVIPELRAALVRSAAAVVVASPGAGKTTRVPLALLDEPWLSGQRIIMLEPRRLAARNAAMFMARERGESVGGIVGYRMRGETRVGKETRLEIVTEGILTRMLQGDQALTGVGAILFDEFHERSLHADLGLALALDVQANLRPELRIVVMSATLDGAAVAKLLGDAPVITSDGRTYPVETRYLDRPSDLTVERQVAAAVLRGVRESEGDVLVFLPGQREIQRVKSLLDESGVPPEITLHLLFGDLPFEKQQAAIAKGVRGNRKIILATSIAETSLTIEGVRVVIDAGLSRRAAFDPRRGMSGLETVPVSRASADQRRGRAGRQSPGVCYRLWTEAQHAEFPPFAKPEILLADLAPLTLELVRWGDPDGSRLRFPDKPPAPHLAQAKDLLQKLGALDSSGSLTQHGRAMSELPLHPRLAHMVLRAKSLGCGALACDVAALLEEGNSFRQGESDYSDFGSRYLAYKKSDGKNPAASRVREQANRIRSLVGVKGEDGGENDLGMLLVLAYPERVAHRRGSESDKFQMASGTGAVLPKGNQFGRVQYLAVADVDGAGQEVRIQLAAPIDPADLDRIAPEMITMLDETTWDEKTKAVVSRRGIRYGSLDLSMQTQNAAPESALRVLLSVVREKGLELLPWSKEAHSLRVRSEWIRRSGLGGNQWPELSDEHLIESLEVWLGPFLHGVLRLSELARLDMIKIVRSLYSHQQLQEVDRLAPTHVAVPTGSRIPLDYEQGEIPVLAVRLQEMFGETGTPRVGGGKVKVLIHLLSPAMRPLAVTQDLSSFWKNAYVQVRKDMRGQYPKHVWPEDPLNAEPTRRTKKHAAR